MTLRISIRITYLFEVNSNLFCVSLCHPASSLKYAPCFPQEIGPISILHWTGGLCACFMEKSPHQQGCLDQACDWPMFLLSTGSSVVWMTRASVPCWLPISFLKASFLRVWLTHSWTAQWSLSFTHSSDLISNRDMSYLKYVADILTWLSYEMYAKCWLFLTDLRNGTANYHMRENWIPIQQQKYPLIIHHIVNSTIKNRLCPDWFGLLAHPSDSITLFVIRYRPRYWYCHWNETHFSSLAFFLRQHWDSTETACIGWCTDGKARIANNSRCV